MGTPPWPARAWTQGPGGWYPIPTPTSPVGACKGWGDLTGTAGRVPTPSLLQLGRHWPCFWDPQDPSLTDRQSRRQDHPELGFSLGRWIMFVVPHVHSRICFSGETWAPVGVDRMVGRPMSLDSMRITPMTLRRREEKSLPSGSACCCRRCQPGALEPIPALENYLLRVKMTLRWKEQHS